MMSRLDEPAWSPTPRTVALFVVLSLLVVGQMYCVLGLAGPMASSLDATAADLTLATTAFGVAHAAGFLFAGPITDRHGPRAVITAGLIACVATTITVASAPTVGWLVAFRAAQGLTAATLAPAAFSYLASHVSPDRRALGITCVTSAMLASAIVARSNARSAWARPPDGCLVSSGNRAFSRCTPWPLA